MYQLNKLFKQFSHFFTGILLGQLFGLITFPILTRILTKEQYGILGLVTTTMLVAVAVAKAGLSDGVVRFYKEYSKLPEKRTVFSSTVFIRGVTLSGLTVFVYVLMFPIISKYLKINDKYIICFMIMAVYLFMRPLNIIVLYFLRVTDKTIFLNAIQLVDKMISVALSLFLLVFVVHDLYGYFIGLVLSEFIISIILFQWFLKRYKIVPAKISKELNLKILKFGIPLLFSELSFLLMSYADRYIIVALYGETVLGLYSVGYNLAMYIGNIIMFSLSYAIVPIYVEIYEKDGKEKTEDFLKKSMHYLIIAVIPMCLGYFAISKDLFITLASEKYSTASKFSPIILIGSFFWAMNSILNAGLYLKKKTLVILIIMVGATVMNIGMNLILLPRFGIMGAAATALITFVSATIITAHISFRYINVGIEIRQVLYYLIISLLMYYIVIQISTSIIWVNLILKIITGIIIIMVGIIYKENGILKRVKQIYGIDNLGIAKRIF